MVRAAAELSPTHQPNRHASSVQVEALHTHNVQLSEYVTQLKLDKGSLSARIQTLEQQTGDLIAENLKLTAQLLAANGGSGTCGEVNQQVCVRCNVDR